MQQQRASEQDPVVLRLAALFSEHPIWRGAAAKLEEEATSSVYFSHLPDEVWHLAFAGGSAELRPGPAADPDLVFRFTPAAVQRLAGVEGGLGEFAVQLFRLLDETQPELRVRLRVAVPFARLVRRGYLGLLAAGGWPVLTFGARRGIRTIAQLRRLLEVARRGQPEPWETGAEQSTSNPDS